MDHNSENQIIIHFEEKGKEEKNGEYFIRSKKRFG